MLGQVGFFIVAWEPLQLTPMKTFKFGNIRVTFPICIILVVYVAISTLKSMEDKLLNLKLPWMLKALHTCRMQFDLTNTNAIIITMQ